MPTRIGWPVALGAALMLGAGCSSLTGSGRGSDNELRGGAEIASAVGERTRAEYEGGKDGELVRYASSLEDAEPPPAEDGSPEAPATRDADASSPTQPARDPTSDDPTEEPSPQEDGDDGEQEGAAPEPGEGSGEEPSEAQEPPEGGDEGEPSAEDDAPPTKKKKDAPPTAGEASTP